MSTNPIAKRLPEAKPKLSAQEWCDIGNDRLAGKIPYRDGAYEVRSELHWFVENGQPRLGRKLSHS